MALVELESSDGIAMITLNDPDRRNAISADLATALIESVRVAADDPAVRAVVISGAGRAFCAGADLAALRNADEAALRHIYQAFLAVRNCPVPTVAAVNGPAVGAGFNLALSCDVRFAAESARFDARFLRIPIHPGGGHFWMLERLLGSQAAAAITMFDDAVSGARAAEVGLAWRCVPDSDLLDAVREFCRPLAESPSELGRRMKRTLTRAADIAEHEEAVDAELVEQLWCVAQQEYLDRMPTPR